MEELSAFVRGLITGENGKLFIEKHRVVIDTVSAPETMMVLDQMFAEGFSNETIKANVGKIINVFYKSLNAQSWDKPGSDHFLHLLMLENRHVETIMTEMKGVVKSLYKDNDADEGLRCKELRELLDNLKSYELHYIKKENILFPYIEKVFPQFRCLKLMWSFHDDFRKSLKVLDQILASPDPDKEVLNKELGKLFFVVLPLVFREEQIVYPVAYRAIPRNSWDEMLDQSFETGWCYINPPSRKVKDIQPVEITNGRINLGTGHLSVEQLILLFDHLPLDITFVDENDEVCYFSGNKHRVFPRSRAIIGRKVQNCHPPESVHIVNEIIAAFRNGSRDHADFWIERKGRFIHIRYFAIRDENNCYKGTIEVTQDVTDIRQLTGQRRLLEWS
jgi:DUF438 domain-containing protein